MAKQGERAAPASLQVRGTVDVEKLKAARALGVIRFHSSCGL